MTAIARIEGSSAAALEGLVVYGDLSQLSVEEKTSYMVRVCESVGLNPLTTPFAILKLNGKEVLYAKRDASDQLRKVHSVSVEVIGRERTEDMIIVTTRATLPSGRTDESIGAVSIAGLKGEALANALMKAETKAKRRVTLCICGLGFLDETEVDSIPNATTSEVRVDAEFVDARSEEQAKRRLEGEEAAEEWIPLIERLQTKRDLESFLDFNGYQMQQLHANARSKLWNRILKACNRFEMKPDEAKQIIREAPEYPEQENEQ